jgi:hypothetical protein
VGEDSSPTREKLGCGEESSRPGSEITSYPISPLRRILLDQWPPTRATNLVSCCVHNVPSHWIHHVPRIVRLAPCFPHESVKISTTLEVHPRQNVCSWSISKMPYLYSRDQSANSKILLPLVTRASCAVFNFFMNFLWFSIMVSNFYWFFPINFLLFFPICRFLISSFYFIFNFFIFSFMFPFLSLCFSC